MASHTAKEMQHGDLLVLLNFTDQGIRNVKGTTKRADLPREMAKKFGVTSKELYWTLGSYDLVHIFEAPDDAAMAALLASLGALGNVRTQTLRAFSQAERWDSRKAGMRASPRSGISPHLQH